MTRKKTTKPKLAEVKPIKIPDPQIIEVLEELLGLAESGEITSLRMVVDVNRKANFVACGEIENLHESISVTEMIKATLVDELYFSMTDGAEE